MPDPDDADKYNAWAAEAKKFGKAVWAITGGVDVDIVFEHPGEDTFPVSTFIVRRGGMVVFCAGTTGYLITFDARYVWMRQKRVQGSHFASKYEADEANHLVMDKRVSAGLSRTFAFKDTAQAHELMADNRHPPGNMAIAVNATAEGCRNLGESIAAQRIVP